jgi:hypothetical protein
MNPAFIIVCAARIRKIPIVEFIVRSLVMAFIAIPIRNGGNRKGTVKTAETIRPSRGLIELSQNPTGTPTKALRAALTTAMKAVVSSSSKLVIKNV